MINSIKNGGGLVTRFRGSTSIKGTVVISGSQQSPTAFPVVLGAEQDPNTASRIGYDTAGIGDNHGTVTPGTVNGKVIGEIWQSVSAGLTDFGLYFKTQVLEEEIYSIEITDSDSGTHTLLIADSIYSSSPTTGYAYWSNFTTSTLFTDGQSYNLIINMYVI